MTWFQKKKIVVPIDFSDESFAALDVAVELADDSSQVMVVHVVDPVSAADWSVGWAPLDETGRLKIENLLRKRLSENRFQRVQAEVRFGDPGQTVVNLAQECGAELIVMPSHGRRGVPRLMVGSVAERVTRLAHCPVLILRK